eukprot:972322-Pelagomonas_calceolata.AAC.1
MLARALMSHTGARELFEQECSNAGRSADASYKSKRAVLATGQHCRQECRCNKGHAVLALFEALA